jgi:hypothetical protein
LLLLDESQYVKNAATKAATAIRSLTARHPSDGELLTPAAKR